MIESNANSNKVINTEIDVIEIIRKLWKNRTFLIKISVFFSIIGFFVAVITPNVYTASCTMVPQTGEKKPGGNLSGLAAMAGINLGSLSLGEDVLSPTIYPKILTNLNFQKELIYSNYHVIKVKQPITLFEYYTNEKNRTFSLPYILKKYTVGLPGVISKAIKSKSRREMQTDSSNINSLTKDENEIFELLNKNISIKINEKEGYVSLIVEMPEPLLAAELAQKVQELLQKYITEYKIEKVTHNLEFVEKSYNDAKKNFELKQAELARFRDSNKSLSSAIAKTQEEKLSSEYTLLLGIYSELAKQKEQAKIAVTEKTPILTIIEPVFVPIEKSKPSRILILILISFLGLVAGIGIIVFVPHIEANYITNLSNWKIIPKIF